MIAGFIFFRLRAILGRRTGHEKNVDTNFSKEFSSKKFIEENLNKTDFNDNAKNEFLKGAKIAYERIITNFAKGNLKDIKPLLDNKVFDQFNEAVKDKKNKSSNHCQKYYIYIFKVIIHKYKYYLVYCLISTDNLH